MPEVRASPPPLRERAWFRRACFAVAALVLAAFFAKSVRSVLDGTDGYVFFVSARALVEGQDPREPMFQEVGDFVNPPSSLFAFLPLAALGRHGYAVAWSALNIALILVVPFLAFAVITGRARGHPWWWYFLPALVCFRCLENNNGLAQCNLLVGSLCMLAILCLRRGRPWLAGHAVAAAAAIKLSPALFGIWFLWKREWRAVGGALAGALLWFALLPLVTYGPSGAVDQYRTWRAEVDQLVDPKYNQYDYQPGQSVQATLVRFLSRSSALSPKWGPYYVNVADLDRDAIKRAVPFLSFLILLALLAASRHPTGARDAPGLYLEMGLVVVAMLLMSPYVRKAHFAMLYPVVAMVIAALLRGDVPERAARWLRWSLVAFAVLLNGTSPGLIGESLRNAAVSVSIFLWPTIFFGLALAGAVRACEAEPASGAPDRPAPQGA